MYQHSSDRCRECTCEIYSHLDPGNLHLQGIPPCLFPSIFLKFIFPYTINFEILIGKFNKNLYYIFKTINNLRAIKMTISLKLIFKLKIKNFKFVLFNNFKIINN